jgi:hypothetical protein
MGPDEHQRETSLHSVECGKRCRVQSFQLLLMPSLLLLMLFLSCCSAVSSPPEGSQSDRFEDVWASLNELLRHDNIELPSAGIAFEKFKTVMTNQYSDETEFDKAMFAVVRECLAAFELPQDDDDDTILLNMGGDTQEYAVGITRQDYPATQFFREKNRKGGTTKRARTVI